MYKIDFVTDPAGRIVKSYRYGITDMHIILLNRKENAELIENILKADLENKPYEQENILNHICSGCGLMMNSAERYEHKCGLLPDHNYNETIKNDLAAGRGSAALKEEIESILCFFAGPANINFIIPEHLEIILKDWGKMHSIIVQEWQNALNELAPTLESITKRFNEWNDILNIAYMDIRERGAGPYNLDLLSFNDWKRQLSGEELKFLLNEYNKKRPPDKIHTMTDWQQRHYGGIKEIDLETLKEWKKEYRGEWGAPAEAGLKIDSNSPNTGYITIVEDCGKDPGEVQTKLYGLKADLFIIDDPLDNDKK